MGWSYCGANCSGNSKVDSLEKVDLMAISRRKGVGASGSKGVGEFRCQNPDLVKEVVGILLKMNDEV